MQAEDFVNLFNSIYSRRIDSAYYYWRFGCQDANAFILSAEDDQGLKGCIGYHLLDMGNFKAALVVDAMIANRCRGDGRTFVYLNRKLEKCARAHGAKALFMLPNSKGAKAWSADKHWALTEHMTTYMHRVRTGHLGALRCFQVQKFGQWVNRIESKFRVSNPELICVGRTKAYLNWRFANPMHDYEIYQVYRAEKHRPFGYLVLKTFTDPITREETGDIVDILWSENDACSLMDMLRVALKKFHSRGIHKVTMWLQTNTILDAVGRFLGFVPTERQRAFCVKILDRDYAALSLPNNWFLTMADSEIY
jgi:hypothetical protein